MSQFDLMPYSGPHAPYARIMWFNCDVATDTETFEQGEPVRLDNGGNIVECADDMDNDNIIGFAAAGPGASRIDPNTGNAYADDAVLPVYMPDSTTWFAAQVFATDGAGTSTAPVATAIGDEAGFTLASGVWSIDIGTSNNLARIVDVIDVNGVSLILPNAGAGVTTIFALLAHQMVPDTGTVNAPAA